MDPIDIVLQIVLWFHCKSQAMILEGVVITLPHLIKKSMVLVRINPRFSKLKHFLGKSIKFLYRNWQSFLPNVALISCSSSLLSWCTSRKYETFDDELDLHYNVFFQSAISCGLTGHRAENRNVVFTPTHFIKTPWNRWRMKYNEDSGEISAGSGEHFYQAVGGGGHRDALKKSAGIGDHP